MKKKSVILYLLILGTLPLSTSAIACAEHLYLDTQNMGFFGRTAAKMVGLAPPERVFKLKHTSTTWATIGEQTEIQVDYQRPFFAEEVRIELSGTKNVSFPEEELKLDDRTGMVTVRFQVTEADYTIINLTVVGEHKGETVREYSRIYVRSRPESTSDDMQVSAR